MGRVLLAFLILILSACGTARKPVVVQPNVTTRSGAATPYALREILLQGMNNLGANTVLERLLPAELEKEFASRNVFGKDVVNGYRLVVRFEKLDDGPLLLNVLNAFVPPVLTGEKLSLTARFTLIDADGKSVHRKTLSSSGRSSQLGGGKRLQEIHSAIVTDMAERYAQDVSQALRSQGAADPVPPASLSNSVALPLPQADASLNQGSHGLAVGPGRSPYGRYFALVVGNNAYRNLPELETAVSDAQRVGRLLRQRYGFKVRVLLNADRTQILSGLHELRKVLTNQDNLLIYYAGHGYLSDETREGYWLPVTAQQSSTTNWLSNATLTSTIRAMDAKHVLVVADSCFSGQLTRSVSTGVKSPSHLRRMAQLRARTALTSGGLEPVLDGGGNGRHSVFATAFLETLEQNNRPIDTSTLFTRIRRAVALEAEQIPEYGDIRRAGHKGGDFVFVPMSYGQQ